MRYAFDPLEEHKRYTAIAKNSNVMKVLPLVFGLLTIFVLFSFTDGVDNQPVSNAQPPGTAAPNHILFKCGRDYMGCQNMCYYYYCLGRSNYL